VSLTNVISLLVAIFNFVIIL